jgi:hypothetical protein
VVVLVVAVEVLVVVAAVVDEAVPAAVVVNVATNGKNKAAHKRLFGLKQVNPELWRHVTRYLSFTGWR